MSILETAGIISDLKGRTDEDFVLDDPTRGSITIPITDKHVALAVAYFRDHYGTPISYRKLSRLSACDPTKPGLDFTADGISAGHKLSPKQIKQIHEMWLQERSSRITPSVEIGEVEAIVK